MVELRFQEPGQPHGNLLNDLLATAAEAIRGGGVFAWTNEAGVAAALAHDEFANLLHRGSFDLVVGVDAITTEAALRALDELVARHPTLTVRVFLNESTAMFHPKFAWFEIGSGEVVLVVGSGNLTNGGLQRNWEIHTVTRVSGADRDRLLLQIEQWHVDHAARLVATTDPRVIARVRQNVRGDERALLRRRTPPAPPSRVADLADVRVLVAEPTYAIGRWGQANFHLKVFEGFFGARRRVDSWHVFHEVGPAGQIVHTESLKAITSTTSNNFRFELRFGGVTFTRPYAIGVFLRFGNEFVYQMLAPGAAGHRELSDLLDRVAGPPRGNRHRQEEVPVGALVAAWPAAPVLRVPTPSA